MSNDDVNAFVPGPRVHIEGRPGGPLSGLTFAAKDLFDVAGHPTGGGNPDWGALEHCADAACLGRAAAARLRRDIDRQDDHRRGVARHRRRECVLRHAAQPAGAGTRARRLFIWLGRRSRRRDLRYRARHRHRRLGSRAGQLLWPLWHPFRRMAGFLLRG